MTYFSHCLNLLTHSWLMLENTHEISLNDKNTKRKKN